MNILIAKRPIIQLGPRFSAQNDLFHSSSLSLKNPYFLKFCPRRVSHVPKIITFCTNTAHDSLDCYGGWDHSLLDGKFDHTREYNQLQSFLISVGIGDKKYLFVYLLGFICALAISRIKVSSVLVFPACAIVFGLGFSVGFFNGDHMSFNGAKKTPKVENFRESIEKLENLVDLLSGFDANIENLRTGIKKGIDCNQLSLNDLGSFLKTVESIDLAAMNAKSIAEDCRGSMLAENQVVERNFNQKSSRRKKEGSENEFNFTRFFVNLFAKRSTSSNPAKMKDSSKRESTNMEANHIEIGKRSTSSNPTKMKDSSKRESTDGEVNRREQDNVLGPSVEERNSKYSVNGNAEDDTLGNRAINRDKADNLINGARRMNAVAENHNLQFAEMDDAIKAFIKSNKNTYQKRRLEYKSNQEVSWKTGHASEVEGLESHDGLFDSLDFRASLKHQKIETSCGQEGKRDNLEGKFKDFDSIVKGKNENNGSFIREGSVIPDTEPFPSNLESTMASEDMEFSRCLVEANTRLKAAKEYLVQQGDDEVAQNFLCESAGLLLRAINIRPMSLLAIGQLGNTYLLHGELKLRLSRELRALLARANQATIIDEWNAVDDVVFRKDKISSILVNVCDECEELLVKAGRNYRLALSIDGNDMRAMYNWGLALFFRAQLIADIGPGAARDADRVFLAAIDKFDAMMSKSNDHAPDALFRWGAALQQRSRLRPRNTKEKVKLLQQARRLYEDALDFDSENVRVLEALSSCVSELKYWYD